MKMIIYAVTGALKNAISAKSVNQIVCAYWSPDMNIIYPSTIVDLSKPFDATKLYLFPDPPLRFIWDHFFQQYDVTFPRTLLI